MAIVAAVRSPTLRLLWIARFARKKSKTFLLIIRKVEGCVITTSLVLIGLAAEKLSKNLYINQTKYIFISQWESLSIANNQDVIEDVFWNFEDDGEGWIVIDNDGDGINFAAADVDRDGIVTINDVTTLIDYILKGTW